MEGTHEGIARRTVTRIRRGRGSEPHATCRRNAAARSAVRNFALGDGTLDWISSLPLEDPPDALIRAGHMVAVKTTRDTNGDGAPDETVLDLYETAPTLFADGFDT